MTEQTALGALFAERSDPRILALPATSDGHEDRAAFGALAAADALFIVDNGRAKAHLTDGAHGTLFDDRTRMILWAEVSLNAYHVTPPWFPVPIG